MGFKNCSASAICWENGGDTSKVNTQSTLDWVFTKFEYKMISLNILLITFS